MKTELGSNQSDADQDDLKYKYMGQMFMFGSAAVTLRVLSEAIFHALPDSNLDATLNILCMTAVWLSARSYSRAYHKQNPRVYPF